MKKFDLSDNFIFLDNIYFIDFIDKPLNKSNFFYEENGVIVPYLIINSFYEINNEKIQKRIDNYLLNNNNTEANIEIEFDKIQQKAMLFFCEIFEKDNIRYGSKSIQPEIRYTFKPLYLAIIPSKYLKNTKK